MNHLDLLLDRQAVRHLLQCSWLSLLFHDTALHHWVSGASNFDTTVLSCNVITNQQGMQCHIREEQGSFFWLCALTFKEQAYTYYQANEKCKEQANETTYIPEPISSP
jgi:hypothetical protein